MAPLCCVEHFSNCSIAGFAEGFLFFFWPLTAYPLIFFKGSDEVGLFFLFDPNFFLFPLGGDSRYFYLLFLARVFFFFFFFLVQWILVDIRLVNIYLYIYICSKLRESVIRLRQSLKYSLNTFENIVKLVSW